MHIVLVDDVVVSICVTFVMISRLEKGFPSVVGIFSFISERGFLHVPDVGY